MTSGDLRRIAIDLVDPQRMKKNLMLPRLSGNPFDANG
jgi:hypothetical protein